MTEQGVRIQFWGHATLLIEMAGTRLLTDPLLRPLAAGLVHRQPVSKERVLEVQNIDGVLISHLHRDHLDLPSLRQVTRDARTPILVPTLAAGFLARRGFASARDMRPGEATEIGNVRVVATFAEHLGFRAPFGPGAGCIGFVVEGPRRIYFAGDTDVFPGMEQLQPLDVVLLPIAGWGPRLGPGHMDAERAVSALRLLRPRYAVPIHWGTLVPLGLHLWNWSYLTRPAQEFAERAGREMPEVEVRVLQPGESLDLGVG